MQKHTMDFSNIPANLCVPVLASFRKYLNDNLSAVGEDGTYIVQNLLEPNEGMEEELSRIIVAHTAVTMWEEQESRNPNPRPGPNFISPHFYARHFPPTVKDAIHTNIAIPAIKIWTNILNELASMGDRAADPQTGCGVRALLTDHLCFRSREEATQLMKDRIDEFYETDATHYMQMNDPVQASEASQGDLNMGSITMLPEDEVEIPENIAELYWEKYDEICRKEHDYRTDPTQNLDPMFCPIRKTSDSDEVLSWQSLTAELWTMMIIDEATHRLIRKLDYYIETLTDAPSTSPTP